MLFNYIKTAWRQLLRDKVTSFINVLGLALAIAAALLISLYLQHELSYDNWYSTEDRIFRVYRHWAEGSDWVFSPGELSETLAAEVPEVKAATHISQTDEALLAVGDKRLYGKKVVFADSSFFATIPLPFQYGDAATAFTPPNAIVLSQEMAKALFGVTNPIGRAVQLNGQEERVVTGVLADAGHTHLKRDVYVRQNWPNWGWLSNNFATYVRLSPEADLAAVQAKIGEVVNPHIERAYQSFSYEYDETNFPEWGLQPIEKVRLYSRNFKWSESAGGDIRYLYIFGGVGILLLLVAIFNYTNLATARATLRAKEIGVRKVTGALRGQLIWQFLTEAMVQSGIALLAGILLAAALLPSFQNIVQIEVQFQFITQLYLAGSLIIGAIIIGFLAGIYPAFVLARFQPVRVLKKVEAAVKGSFSLRQVLVITQFVAVITMLIVLGFMVQQVDYMLSEDLGFKGEQVLVVPLSGSNPGQRLRQLKSEFRSIPGVQEIGFSSNVPGQEPWHYTLYLEGVEEPVGTNMLFTDNSTADTWELALTAGRYFSEEIAADTLSFVVNETFVRRYNLDDPLNTSLRFFSDSIYRPIIGVVKDFHYQSFDKAIQPLAINGQSVWRQASLKVSTQNLPTTIDQLRQLWSTIEPNHPLRYSFLDESFAQQYEMQLRFRQGMSYATGLIIFIAALGLFGLATFSIQRRRREIGIRKVLGASVQQIVQQLNKDFLTLVIIAIALAIPLGWLVTSKWLDNFAYHIDIEWWVFALAGLAAVGLAFFTISVQSVKAALANPVESLRNE